MALTTQTVTTTTITDDLDGKELAEDTTPTYFGWGGRRYEIYLSDAHYQSFEKALSKYVEASKDVTTQARAAQTRPSSTSRKSASSTDKERLAAIRGWAQDNAKLLQENDLKVPGDRGRLAIGVVELYDAKS